MERDQTTCGFDCSFQVLEKQYEHIHTSKHKTDIIHVYLISMAQNRMTLFEKAVCCLIPLTDLNLCTLNHKGQTESGFDSSAAL